MKPKKDPAEIKMLDEIASIQAIRRLRAAILDQCAESCSNLYCVDCNTCGRMDDRSDIEFLECRLAFLEGFYLATLMEREMRGLNDRE